MPYMKNGKRDYKRQYENYDGKDSVKKDRAARNKAHRDYESKHGDTKMDIDHKIPLSHGGVNNLSNLVAKTASSNRSFSRTSSSKLASQVSKREKKRK